MAKRVLILSLMDSGNSQNRGNRGCPIRVLILSLVDSGNSH